MMWKLKRKIRSYFKGLFTPAVRIKDIRTFKLNFTVGCFENANQIYELLEKDGKYTAYIKPVGKDDEDKTELAVDKTFALKLEQLLAENGVGKWNGFDKWDSRVLDGNSFSCSLTNGKGESLYAHGYMKWPKNYTAVKKEVEKLFESALQGQK